MLGRTTFPALLLLLSAGLPGQQADILFPDSELLVSTASPPADVINSNSTVQKEDVSLPAGQPPPPDVELLDAELFDFNGTLGNQTNVEGLYYTLFASLNKHAEIREQLEELSTNTHSCTHVRGVPGSVRRQLGLSTFYQRYTEAYGIPVLASSAVPDAALRRACYIVRFMFADHAAIRNSYRQRRGRMAIIGRYERTTQIPEHSSLGRGFDSRTRGLGATDYAPVCSIGEENIMKYGYPVDRWAAEDIGLHEFAHGFHILGARYAWPEWTQRLGAAYRSAYSRGIWGKTYANTNVMEYFAEGVLKYHNVEAYSRYPNGVHNHVDTREKLRTYDPTLYGLVKELFPCQNKYVSRRRGGFLAASDSARLRINYPACELDGGETAGDDDRRPQTTQRPGRKPSRTTRRPNKKNKPCRDQSRNCRWWARSGYCYTNTGYMTVSCRQACGLCGSCRDRNSRCKEWAGKGECKKNPGYMLFNCRTSCGDC